MFERTIYLTKFHNDWMTDKAQNKRLYFCHFCSTFFLQLTNLNGKYKFLYKRIYEFGLNESSRIVYMLSIWYAASDELRVIISYTENNHFSLSYIHLPYSYALGLKPNKNTFRVCKKFCFRTKSLEFISRKINKREQF